MCSLVMLLISDYCVLYMAYEFVFYCDGDHRDLHVLTHSFPTRRSSDLTLPRSSTRDDPEPPFPPPAETRFKKRETGRPPDSLFSCPHARPRGRARKRGRSSPSHIACRQSVTIWRQGDKPVGVNSDVCAYRKTVAAARLARGRPGARPGHRR